MQNKSLLFYLLINNYLFANTECPGDTYVPGEMVKKALNTQGGDVPTQLHSETNAAFCTRKDEFLELNHGNRLADPICSVTVRTKSIGAAPEGERLKVRRLQ